MNLALFMVFGLAVITVFAIGIILIGKHPVRMVLMAGIVVAFAAMGFVAQAVAL